MRRQGAECVSTEICARIVLDIEISAAAPVLAVGVILSERAVAKRHDRGWGWKHLLQRCYQSSRTPHLDHSKCITHAPTMAATNEWNEY